MSETRVERLQREIVDMEQVIDTIPAAAIIEIDRVREEVGL